MSKKSIRSKGYRKSAKKPYLSKRDILIVVGVIAVIVIGIVLFNLLYDDGSLDVVDGVAQVQGENSMLINAGSANNPRYYKLGQLADIEGYALESAPAGVDENVREFTYVPEGDSPYDEITVNANANAADILCAATLAAYSSAENTVCSEQMSMDLDGREVLYFTYQREYADETADGSKTAAEDDASATDGTAADDASASATDDGTATEGASTTDGSTADDASATDDSAADDASATDSTAADDTSATDGSTADNASATDGSTADDTSATDSTAADDTSAADGTVADDASATDDSAADDASATDSTAADDTSATDGSTADDASATDGTVADDASTADDADGTTADSSESDVEEIEYLQVLNAYVPVGDRSIVVHLHNDTASEAEYLSSDELVAMMEELLSALSFETE